jgi:hypothetical protein
MSGFGGHRKVHNYDGSTEDGWYTFTCGHCGTLVSGAVVAGYKGRVNWLLCTSCDEGSVANGGTVVPGVPFGPSIAGVPPDTAAAYEQARRSMSVAAYTGAELICRKMLMHIAVERGAPEGKTFAEYVSYLESSGYVTPPMKPWVDVIRKHGNLAAHVIEEPDKTRAESTLMFTAELLRLIYEMDHMSKKYVPSSP